MTGEISDERRISVELSEEEAQIFRLFMEQRDNFMVLYSSGVFLLRGGSANIDFDTSGVIADVKLNVQTFKRGKRPLQEIRVL